MPQDRQIGYDQDKALDHLKIVVDAWLIPFLKRWIGGGPQPIPAASELAALEVFVAELQQDAPPEGYAWLPELLRLLAPAMRFNRQNLVNIHPTPHLPSLIAGLLVSIQNPNNIVKEVSEPTTNIEAQCVSWMAQRLVGFNPSKAWGNVLSGGTLANMTALLVARDYCYRKLIRPRPAAVRQRGLYGLPPGVVLATAGSHYSIKKALWVLGLGDENVISIPVAYDEAVVENDSRDAQFLKGITTPAWRDLIVGAREHDRNRALELDRFYAGEQMPFSLQPLRSEIYKALYACFEYGTPLLAYVFTLGTTDTGTFERPDDEALARLASEDVYIHADAAAGGFALLHPRIRSLANGLDRVHSVTIDGHKLGHLAYPNGALLFREKGWMHEILHAAPYLSQLAPTLEGSRPGSHIVALWSAIHDLGDSGIYVRWLDRLLAFVDRLVAELGNSDRFQVLHEVHLTTVAVAPVPREGESRTDINSIVTRMRQAIAIDKRPAAFLVNIDRGLADIKVRNRPMVPGEPLVDIVCLRIVATNPALDTGDARALVDYLSEHLDRARG